MSQTRDIVNHYAEAEDLLREGRRVVEKIKTASTHRAAIESQGKTNASDRYKLDELTRDMDEYGKKAMGIWAQAQGHALLALHDAVMGMTG